MYNLPQKLLAEFFGTFAMVFIAAGAISASEYLAPAGQGNPDWLYAAAAYGLSYGVLRVAVGRISGAHLNPAVTAGYWVTRRLGTLQSIAYWAAQVLGSLAAAYLLVAILPDAGWRDRALGAITPGLAPGFTRLQGMAIEGALTFVVVFVVFATAGDVRAGLGGAGGFAAGGALAVAVLMAGPFTGGSLNPARCFGPAFVARRWDNHGVYWVGPLLGGVLAAVLYDWAFRRDRPAA